MKNLLLLLALACSAPAFSQTKKEVAPNGEARQKFSLGILGGLNINSMPFQPVHPTGDRSFNPLVKPEYGFFAGVSARQPIFKRFAVKMDVQFARKGYGIKNETNSPFVQEHYQAAYLDFVPQLEYKAFKNLYLSLGGYCGVRMDERVKFHNQDWATINPDFITLAEDTDWGLASGLRLEFGRVSAMIKYQQGLTPGIKLELQDDTGVISSSNQYHHSLQVGLGFKII